MEAAFNTDRILGALSKIEFHQQMAFGAGCCERMLPNYVRFMNEVGWGDVQPLRRGVDTVWEACSGKLPSDAELRGLISQCERNIPDSEDFTSLYTSAAQDAACAVCALLDFLLDRDLERLAAVPRLSTDSVDLIVQEQEELKPQDPLLKKRIREHPLMQQELLRQRRDLAEASRIAAGDLDALRELRRRAQHESSLTLSS